MRRPAPAQEEPKQGAPAYITTFSDMVTLLLTFFVLLLSLSKLQDAGLIATARESFIQRMTSWGIRGVLFGKAQPQTLQDTKVLFSVDDPEQTDERTLDPDASRIQELYQKLTRSVEALMPQVIGATVAYLPKDIRFGPGQAHLDEQDKQLLRQHMAKLTRDLDETDVRIYVVGVAAREPTEKSRWIISARRAEAVASVMRESLPEGLGWQVHSWGVGEGGEWTGQAGQMAQEADILVAVLRQTQ
ncbi:MAG TPA: flagellar motor protein MotB [Sedimentisphaerales bacterium]|nr:flagellar motor protein MotB [Sedimentisphaerales bacterium]